MAALAAVYTRELTFVLAPTAREIAQWRRRARRIPCPELRSQALFSLQHKRLNIEGSALLATLPSARSRALVRTLVACDIIGDFLDTTLERALRAGGADSMQLHGALRDTVSRSEPVGGYYRGHPWKDDGGYLQALVSAARDANACLPAIESVRPYAERTAQLVSWCQSVAHETDPQERRAYVTAMTADGFGCPDQLNEAEWVAAGSGWLTLLAMLASAADGDLVERRVSAVYGLYYPWVSLAATMLDSYADLDEDAASGNQSFLSNYTDTSTALDRLGEVLLRTLEEARRIERGRRHRVVIESMVAMYLSKDGALGASRREQTSRLLAETGNASRLLFPAIRGLRLLRREGAD